jgi:microcystin-dependent protein
VAYEDPIWAQGKSYSAREDRQVLQSIWPQEGVLPDSSGVGGLNVTQRAAGANFSVDVAVGKAVIAGDDQPRQGSYVAINLDVTNLVIAGPPGSGSRIDVIIFRVYDPNAGSGASPVPALEVVAGTPGTPGAAPAVPNTAIALAQILVSAGLGSVTNSVITDRRSLAGGGGGMPSGSIVAFAGSVVPSGWLLCNGQAVSRSSFFGLFASLGTAWGSGDGSTTFNVPDLRGRTVIGAGTGTGLSTRVLATTLGEENHTLSQAEMPAHDHSTLTTAETANHTHSAAGANYFLGQSGSPSLFLSETGSPFLGVVPVFNTSTESGPHQHTIPTAGSNGAHNTIQPSSVANWIVKA